MPGEVSLSAREATCVRGERGDGERVCAVTGRMGEKGSSWAALGHAGGKGGGTAWARKVGSGPRERGKRVGRAQGEVGWALVWAAGFGFCWVSFPLFFSISKQLKPI